MAGVLEAPIDDVSAAMIDATTMTMTAIVAMRPVDHHLLIEADHTMTVTNLEIISVEAGAEAGRHHKKDPLVEADQARRS